MISLKDILNYKTDIVELIKMAGYTNIRIYYNQTDVGQHEFEALAFIVDGDQNNENNFLLEDISIAYLLAEKLGCYVTVTIANEISSLQKNDVLEQCASIDDETKLAELSKEKSLEKMLFSPITDFEKEMQVDIKEVAARAREKLIKQYLNDEKLKQLLEKNFSLTNTQVKLQNKENQISTFPQQSDLSPKRKKQKSKGEFCEAPKSHKPKNGFFSSKTNSENNGKVYLQKLKEKKQKLSAKGAQKNSALKPNS